MTYGVQTFNSSGALIWDSNTAGSGVIADVKTVAGDVSATFTYPDFTGRSCGVIVLDGFGDNGVSSDTALGYPRVTVPSYPNPRTILVAVF
jgi:hypothetical protein